MAKLIDISVSLRTGIPTWPGVPPFCHSWLKRLERGDVVNSSAISMDVHTGTHIDAPLHFLGNGDSVNSLDLDRFCGLAQVIEFMGAGPVTAQFLDSASPPERIERLLIKSRNSSLWKQERFCTDYTALSEDAAQWVVDKGIRLVGVDYLSVQCFDTHPRVHSILLEAGVAILEGLDLSNVTGGVFELLCLPLSISGSEGAPARAVLREISK